MIGLFCRFGIGDLCVFDLKLVCLSVVEKVCDFGGSFGCVDRCVFVVWCDV